ncbi:lycopene cyclase domain-containing protein [candidate division KSB1 bacterium]|nr:lycopene cyclase domain-containing protein [candidate division KSB1 bacterium]
MKAEYFLFNLFVIAGPLIMSFEKRIFFFSKWRYAFPAIALVAAPFILWDALVTGRHWQFNSAYTFDFRFAGLPVEEWLFFFTVPFAALFVWEVIASYLPDRKSAAAQWFWILLLLCPLPGIVAIMHDKEYTALVLLFLGLAASLDYFLQTRLFLRKRILLYFAATIGMNLICNSYLTARPVVLYEERYQLGMRLGTIPLEDFGYGFALISLTVILYERFKLRAHA